MKTYIVTLRTTGAEVYRYQAEAAIEWQGMEFETHDHTEAPAEPIQPAQSSEPRHITRRSFWNRFPPAKERTMQAVMVSGAPLMLAAELKRQEKRVSDSPFVDLDLEETRIGVLMLASAAVPETIDLDGVTVPLRLTLAEAVEVLDGPISEGERYRGKA